MSGNRYFSGDSRQGPGRWVGGGNESSLYGFNNQNNQEQYSNQYNSSWNQNANFGFTESSNYGGGNYLQNNTTVNSPNDATYENYYGMADNYSSNYNMDQNSDHTRSNFEPMTSGSVSYGQFSNGRESAGNSIGSGFPPCETGFVNSFPSSKKKGAKRPLPDDPKERKRIKRNNRSNKISNMAKKKDPVSRKQLIKMAAKNAPDGVNVTKIGLKRLRTLAGPELFANKKVDINQLPKSALVQIAAKHVSDRVNVSSFTKKGLKNLIKRIDPDYVPPAANPTQPLSKRQSRIQKAQELEFARFMKKPNVTAVNALSNPIKIIQTPSARKKEMLPFRKNRPKQVMENRKFTPNSIKQLYKDIKANGALDYNGVAVVGYLRFTLFQVYPNQRAHCLEICHYVLEHHNVLKLLRYEVKKLLDQRFGANNRLPDTKNGKRKFLLQNKTEVLEDDVHFFQDDLVAKRAGLIDECIAVLTADVYPADLVPAPSEYMRDPNVIPPHAESVLEFKHLFITYTYEALGYIITSKLSVDDQVKFHLENPIIPGLLVEFVRSYDTYVFITDKCLFKVKPGDQLALPPALKNHLERKASVGYIRNTVLGKIYDLLLERKAQLQTNIVDVLPEGAKPSTGVLRDFANFVIFSDEMVSIARYRLIEHSPFLPLTGEEKVKLFDNLVKNIYRQGLDIWTKKLSIHDLTFKDVKALLEDTKPGVETEQEA